MNIFISIVPKHGDDVIFYKNKLKEVAKYTVPFYDLEHNKHIWNNDGILSASFSIHEKQVSIKDYSSYTDEQFLTFNGLPILDEFSQNNIESWADIFLRKILKGDILLENLGGYFNLLYANKDIVRVYNSLSLTEPIYWMENDHCVAIGNRASLVYALANSGKYIDYNKDAFISLCTAGWFVHDFTPYKGLNKLKAGSEATIKKGNITIRKYKESGFTEYPFEEGKRGDILYNQIYDEITHELLKSVKMFNGFSNDLTISLTGGKDSRIAAALCKEAGLNFRCFTSGGPEDRDVIVASEVAHILGVNHSTTKRQNHDAIPKVDIFEMIDRQVRLSDGSSNVYDPCYPIRLKPNVQFAGHGGELFRGGYEMIRGGKRPPIREKKDAIRFLENLNLHNSNIILTDEAIEKQRLINDMIIEEFYDSSFPASNFYDYMYYVYREGRAIANNRHASAFGSFQNTPFLNDNALSLCWKLPLELRRNDRLYYNILLRLNPLLAEHRFADSRWKFEEDGPNKNTSLNDWRKREPLPASSRTHQVHSWRNGYDSYMRNEIKEYLLSKNNQIFEIIDYDKLTKVLNKPGPTSLSIIRSIFGVMCSNYFLSNEWIDNGNGGQNIKKNVDNGNGTDVYFSNFPIRINNSKVELLPIDENSLVISWKKVNNDENLYIQTFDKSFNLIPSKRYLKSSEISSNFNKVNININALSKRNNSLTLFFMQYNNEQRIKNDFFSFNINQHYQNYSFKFKILEETRYYKIAIKINNKKYTNGCFTIKDLKLNFN